MSRPYAILRIGRVRSWGSVAAMAQHHTRSRPTLNADPLKPPVQILGSGDPHADISSVIARHGIRPRSNAVLCLEFLLTASPEFFRPGRPDEYGVFDVGRLQAWLAANVKWVSECYGDRAVSAALHLDEATPHIHLCVLPLEFKTDRRTRPPKARWGLNARGLIGDRRKLSELQDHYAQAMAPLGLQRGVAKSVTGARHTAIREYYRDPQAALRAAADARERVITSELEERKARYRGLVRDYREIRRAVEKSSIDGVCGYDWLTRWDIRNNPPVRKSEICVEDTPHATLADTQQNITGPQRKPSRRWDR